MVWATHIAIKILWATHSPPYITMTRGFNHSQLYKEKKKKTNNIFLNKKG